MNSLLPAIFPLTQLGLSRGLRPKLNPARSVLPHFTESCPAEPEDLPEGRNSPPAVKPRTFDPPSRHTRAHAAPVQVATQDVLECPKTSVAKAAPVTAAPAKPKSVFLVPFDPPCRRTRSRLAAATKGAVPQAAVYDAPSRHTRACAGRPHQHRNAGPNGSVHRGVTRKLARAPAEQLKAALNSAPLPSAFPVEGATNGDLSTSSSSCPSVDNIAQSSSSSAVVEDSDSNPPPVVGRKPKSKPGAKKGRRRKRSVEAVLNVCNSEPPAKKVNRTVVLHSSQKRLVLEPPRPPPHPGVPLELTTPPSHPLPTDVAVLCRSKQTEEHRWCQILDHYQSCGDRWMYYVHYAGTDRRLDEWVDTERVDLSSARPSLPAGLCEDHLVTRDAADQKFSEILQRSEKHMVHSVHDFERSVITRTKTVDAICFGSHEINAWYFSPYPVQSSRVLHICEYCLKYVVSAELLAIHYQKCRHRYPPGDEIYRDAAHRISVFEVSGRNERMYCQNLCLLAKLFLDHKTMYYDVQHFMFYVLCQFNEEAQYGYKMVGYFSKERVDDWNLACILILPPFQKRGFGRFLIEFSYELSKKESKPGTPERPLSDLGRVSYFSFWKDTLLREIIRREGESVSIKFLSSVTAIKSDDIVHTLQALNCLHAMGNGSVVIKVPPKLREEVLANTAASLGRVHVDVSRLHYYPPSPHGR
eukprot:RCo022204